MTQHGVIACTTWIVSSVCVGRFGLRERWYTRRDHICTWYNILCSVVMSCVCDVFVRSSCFLRRNVLLRVAAVWHRVKGRQFRPPTGVLCVRRVSVARGAAIHFCACARVTCASLSSRKAGTCGRYCIYFIWFVYVYKYALARTNLHVSLTSLNMHYARDWCVIAIMIKANYVLRSACNSGLKCEKGKRINDVRIIQRKICHLTKT